MKKGVTFKLYYDDNDTGSTVTIPQSIRDKRYEVQECKEGGPDYDIDECQECGRISLTHLGAMFRYCG